MEQIKTDNGQAESAKPAPPVASAVEMTLLELNKINLDETHTVLTSNYLEEIYSKK